MNNIDNLSNSAEAILLAAKKVFLQKGYAGATTTEIARQAGVTHAMLHYYYGTKENIFIKILESSAQEMMTSFSSALNSDLPFFEKIKVCIELHFDFVVQNPTMPFFLLNEFISNVKNIKMAYPFLNPIMISCYNILQEQIQNEVANNNIRYIEASHLLYNIISLNVCSVMIQPLSEHLFNINQEEYKAFLAQRKLENIEIIFNRLYK